MIIFFSLWGQNAVKSFLASRSGELSIHAALKPGMDELKGEELASRLRAQNSGIDIRVVGAAEGRSLLALQEPWVSSLPDVEVSELPVLLEIKHPDLIQQPASVEQFIKMLNDQPEVDFVAFNQVGQDRLVAFAGELTASISHICKWAVILAALISVLQFAFTITGSLKQSAGAAATRAVIVGVAGWCLAAVGFRLWERFLPQGLGGPVYTSILSLMPWAFYDTAALVAVSLLVVFANKTIGSGRA